MLTTFFAEVKDFRRPQGRKYELPQILLLSVIAILCNAKSYRDISRFIRGKFDELKWELQLNWKKPPAYTTIRNIIQGTDGEELEAAFRALTQSQTKYGFDKARVHIAIDGKTLRNSFDHFEDRKALQKLMFFDTADSLILGHIPIDEKTNEIPAFQSLLAVLEIPNALFTADAMHCQKKTFAEAENKHELLVQLKSNQQSLLEDVQCLTKQQLPCDTHTVRGESGHGRIAHRTTSVYQKKLDDFIMDDDWAASIQTVAVVNRSTAIFDTKKKHYVNRQETALYLANCKLTAMQAHQIVIKHWGIENSNHYVRDVSLQEDASRIRTHPYNIAVLRSTALNIMRNNGVTNIKGELYENSIHWTKVFRYPQVN